MTRLEIDKKELTYRIYITDALKAIGHLNVRYATLIDSKHEERTSDEIIASLKNKVEEVSKS